MLTRAARSRLLKLIANAGPLNGTFFRSVAFRYFHPDDLISGEGPRQHGGRFVPVGVRAVYASAEEDTALREVTQRKATLGGEHRIDVGEYPRMIYLLSISTQRNLDLTNGLDKQVEQVVWHCLAGRGHAASQELAVTTSAASKRGIPPLPIRRPPGAPRGRARAARTRRRENRVQG